MSIYPRFDLYPLDFIGSIDCCKMTLEQFGLFTWMLYHSWVFGERPCHLPNDPETIVFLLRINSESFDRCWPVVSKKWVETEDGKFIYNKRLLSEYEKCVGRSKTYSDNRLGKKKTIDKQLINNGKSIDRQAVDADTDADVGNGDGGKREEGSGGKPKKQAFIPPDIGEFKKYCEEHQHYGIAQKAFDYYSAANWHDGKGNPVRNWKQKLIAVWFKDENKDPPPQIIRPKVLTPQQQWERDNPNCYKNRPSVAPLIKGLADVLSMPQLNEPMRKK